MINFPTSIDSDSTLYLAVNNKRTTLTAGIDAVTLTIPVGSTSGFPSSGFITILTGSNITLAECIAYSSVGPTQFNATLRGADGTTAQAHNSGDNVDLTIVAAHHNTAKDAIIELERFVGVSGSENFVRNRSGSAIIPQNTITNYLSTNTLVVSGSLTVSGTPVLTSFKAIVGAGPVTVTSGSNAITVRGFDVLGTGLNTVVTGTNTLTVLSKAITGSRGITVISGSNSVLISGTLPYKATSSFTTTSIAGTGGVGSFDQAFNNRSLVRKLTITPSNGSANSMIVEFFGRDTFSAGDLEYRATLSGTYVDNETWFHEDLDGTAEYHLRITNNSLVSSQFTVDTIQEVFEP